MATTLHLHDLAARHPGITTAIGAALSEAACVCLDRHHASPAEVEIDSHTQRQRALVSWKAIEERVRIAWANEIDTTEWGAMAMALAAVELAEGMVAVRRAETHTGADYYIAPTSAVANDFEFWFRLEISGINDGSDAAIRRRLRMKVAQALSGFSNLPALAAVVAFRTKFVAIAKVE